MIFVIIGSAIVTFIPRVLPLLVMSRFQLPKWGMRWLGFVPVAAMAALAGQEVLTRDGEIWISFSNAELWAAIPALLAAVVTRSLLATVLAGVISLMLLRYVIAL